MNKMEFLPFRCLQEAQISSLKKVYSKNNLALFLAS
jgi:hypothetical protein